MNTLFLQIDKGSLISVLRFVALEIAPIGEQRVHFFVAEKNLTVDFVDVILNLVLGEVFLIDVRLRAIHLKQSDKAK